MFLPFRCREYLDHMVDREWALVALSGFLLPGCYSGHPDSSDPFVAGAWDGEDSDDDDDDDDDDVDVDDDADDDDGDGDGNAGDDDDAGDGGGNPGDGGGDPGDGGGDPGDGGGDPGDGGGDPGDGGGDPGDGGGDPGDGGGDPGDGGGGPGDGGGDDPPADGIPSNAYCDPVGDWEAGWSNLEQEVLELVNEARAVGGNCGTEGNFGPSAPLTMDGALRCAGRNHSMNMANDDFFAHTAPNGETPWDRIAASGYGGYATAGENIAAGYPSPAAVVQGWLDSDGHCANMLNSAFEEIGIGYFGGGSYGSYWTQNFATK